MTRFPVSEDLHQSGTSTGAVTVRSPIVGDAPVWNGSSWVSGTTGASLAAANTWAQAQTMPDIVLSGLAGATASGRFAGLTSSGRPGSGTFLTGDFVLSIATGDWWVCTAGGTPGTWISPTAVPSPLLAHVAAPFVGPTDVTTTAVDTTGATLLVAAIGWYPVGAASGALTDSKGNTWTVLATHQDAGTNLAVCIAYCATPVVGSGHTFSTNFGGSHYPAIAAAAFSGTAGTAADVNDGNAVSSAASVQPGTATPAHPNEIIVTAGKQGVDEPVSVDSGFAIAEQVYGIALAWQKQGAAAALNPTWTGTTVTQRAAAMASWQ